MKHTITYTLSELQDMLPTGRWISTWNCVQILRQCNPDYEHLINLKSVSKLIRTLPDDKVLVSVDSIYTGNDEYLFVDDTFNLHRQLKYDVYQLSHWKTTKHQGMIDTFQNRIDTLSDYKERIKSNETP